MPLASHLHWLPLAIFLLTYGLIAIESNLGWHLHRPATAFCGAVATMHQAMITGGRTAPPGYPVSLVPYTTNQLIYVVYPTEIYSEVEPQSGATVKECEYDSNSKVGKKKCNP